MHKLTSIPAIAGSVHLDPDVVDARHLANAANHLRSDDAAAGRLGVHYELHLAELGLNALRDGVAIVPRDGEQVPAQEWEVWGVGKGG
ncbi:hypothetical protein F751_1577 [Auxenochlorella protothecoides]|uniref:Uncharacterized protein n=1 Tax=Auxenochlorella protothecoides TaxID=3075 RepID=A0A087STZ7_AUXPR|nr:hypothetical protein F751_1577 [Auxenochlorella protothecoides]KFM29201.1 hypothetical protein F751_1577 [Auxenochlorella protothecoides]